MAVVLLAGNADATLHLAAPTALAARPEADPAQHPHLQVGAIEADTHVLDADAMERARQSRLRRWQRQPNAAA